MWSEHLARRYPGGAVHEDVSPPALSSFVERSDLSPPCCPFFLGAAPVYRCNTFAPVDRNAPRLSEPAPALLSEREQVAQFFDEEAKRAYIGDVPRGSLCAFVAGTAYHLDQLEVTVTSILEFQPGMRVAVAAQEDAVDEYRR